MKTWLTALAKQRETKCHEMRQTLNFFHVFYSSSNRACFDLMGDHFFGAHSKIGATTSGFLHIVMSDLQLTVFTSSHLAANSLLFLFSTSCPLLMAFLFESFSANWNSLLILT